MTVETSSSAYTHVVCGQCGTLLYCSQVEPWSGQGGTEYGWCPHDPDAVDGPSLSTVDWPRPSYLHRCNGVMRGVVI